MAGGKLYSQTSLPFWRAMVGCIAIGSLATAMDWFVSFTLHEPIMGSHNCVIEKGFSEGEKRDFPILTVIVPISQGTEVMKVTEYVSECSCGSVVEHCVSSSKVVGSIPREHTY